MVVDLATSYSRAPPRRQPRRWWSSWSRTTAARNETPRPPLPARSDGKHGRHWGRLEDSSTSKSVLASQRLRDRLDARQRRGRTAAPSAQPRCASTDLLEMSAGDHARRERHFVYSPQDVERFTSAGGYTPLLAGDVGIPPDVNAAILDVQERVARSAFGESWRQHVRPISFQITSMGAGNDRGNHTDPTPQGDFIASYTASGSCSVRLDHVAGEAPEAASPLNNRRAGVKMLLRRQEAGCFYGIRDESRTAPAMHRIEAHDRGHVSVTYRFVYTAAQSSHLAPG